MTIASAGVIWPKDRSVTTDDGATITYTFLGPSDGPTVALCAGFLCPDTFWHHLAPALAAAGHRVLLFHYRGIATSSRPPADRAASYTVARCAQDLEAIVIQEAIDGLAILGHSMGVQVALEAYRLLADRTRALVSVTGPFASPMRTLYDRGPLITYGVYHPLRSAVAALPASLRRTVWQRVWALPALEVGRMVRAFGPRTDPMIAQSYIDHAGALDPAVVLHMAAGMHGHDARALLPHVAVPTLVVAGGRDPFTPPSQARIMAGLIPDATLRTARNGTHGTIIEYPGLVNGWILDFLARVAPTAALR